MSELSKSVREFICLESEINSFKGILDSVSKYLNVNPAQKLLELIRQFNGDTYVDLVKSHLEQLINELSHKLKYDQIISHLHSLAKPYNKRLEQEFKSFKSKVGEYRSTLEESIKDYIENINTSLEEHRCCVQKLISKICQNIENLKANYSKLTEFRYDKKEQIIRLYTIFDTYDIKRFDEIFKTHEKYKKCLTNCYSKIKCELNEFRRILRFYNLWINYSISRLGNVTLIMNNNFDINHILSPLEKVKFYVDNFKNYESCVQKLDKIGEHIKTMKDNLNQVQNQVDEGAKSYIKELEEITIKESDVQNRIKNIKSVNDSLIVRLKISKKAIEFKKSLEKEISNLTHTFYDFYDFYDNQYIDYLEKDFCTVKRKVESFETTIKSKHDAAKMEIKEIKNKNGKVTKDALTCEEKTREEKDGDDLISDVKTCIDSSISDINQFIEKSLNDINAIRHMLSVLEDNKNQSMCNINKIKSNVSGINELKDATSKLAGARSELDSFSIKMSKVISDGQLATEMDIIN